MTTKQILDEVEQNVNNRIILFIYLFDLVLSLYSRLCEMGIQYTHSE